MLWSDDRQSNKQTRRTCFTNHTQHGSTAQRAAQHTLPAQPCAQPVVQDPLDASCGQIRKALDIWELLRDAGGSAEEECSKAGR